MDQLTLIPAARDRLILCLRLFECPGTTGERDAAYAAAVRILRAHGLDWNDVIVPPALTRPHAPFEPDGWHDAVAFAKTIFSC